MKRVIVARMAMATWTAVFAIGCVAEAESDGAGGSTATPEEVGEVVDEVTLGQCRLACAAGGAYFERLFCSAIGGLLGSSVCKIAVMNATGTCRSGCRRNMDRNACGEKCCDAASEQLERYCSGVAVPDRLKNRCWQTTNHANGECRRTCR